MNLVKNEQLRARVEEIAAAKKCSLNHLALAWLQHKGKDIVPIPGMDSECSTLESIRASVHCSCKKILIKKAVFEHVET